MFFFLLYHEAENRAIAFQENRKLYSGNGLLDIARIIFGNLLQKWNDSSLHFRSGGILVKFNDKQ